MAKLMPELSVDIVKRSATAKGVEVLPRRWVVEITITRFDRCGRLTKDFENLNCTAVAFIRLPSIRLMVRKLWNPA